MTTHIVVTGTDTGIGKTVFAAGLTRLLDGVYFKPVQAGLEGDTDTVVAQRLSALPVERMLPETKRTTPPTVGARSFTQAPSPRIRLPAPPLSPI